MFENKTNSLILANLSIDERLFKFDYMSKPGMGLDLLNTLHTIVSPEELFRYGRAYGMTKHNLKALKGWLDNNCRMQRTMEIMDMGYGFTRRAIMDNGSWGVLTKIRRHIIEWEPKITSNGKIIAKHLDYLTEPEVIFTNEDSLLVIRRCNKGAYTQAQDFEGKDLFYERQKFCFKLDQNEWRKGTYAEKIELIHALNVMNTLLGINEEEQ